MKSGDKVGQTCPPSPAIRQYPVWISTGGSAFLRFPIRIRENCLPNVTSFLGNESRLIRMREQFLRSAENSKFLRWIRFSCRGISLFWEAVSPPGYMNAKDSAFRVIETLNRFFDTVEISGEQFVCKREKRKQFLMDVSLVAPFFEFLSSLDSLAGEKKEGN